MIGEAKLERAHSGLVPGSEGWFVVNVRDSAWIDSDRFGSGCGFENTDQPFPEFGINVQVLSAGQPNALYHRETNQEDFLVLSGKCRLLVEGEERELRHGTSSTARPRPSTSSSAPGRSPASIVMVGARKEGSEVFYPVSGLARRYEAGVDQATDSPREAYGDTARLRVERPPYWGELPWA